MSRGTPVPQKRLARYLTEITVENPQVVGKRASSTSRGAEQGTSACYDPTRILQLIDVKIASEQK